jgi:hypothetical protein
LVDRYFHIGLTGQVEERGLSNHPEEILLILLICGCRKMEIRRVTLNEWGGV